jgi:hypothetical protein
MFIHIIVICIICTHVNCAITCCQCSLCLQSSSIEFPENQVCTHGVCTYPLCYLNAVYMLMLASSLCTYNVDHVCAAFCVIRRSHMLQHCCGLLSALHLEACSEAAWAYKLLMHLVNTCSSAHYSTLVNLSCALHCVCVCVIVFSNAGLFGLNRGQATGPTSNVRR